MRVWIWTSSFLMMKLYETFLCMHFSDQLCWDCDLMLWSGEHWYHGMHGLAFIFHVLSFLFFPAHGPSSPSVFHATPHCSWHFCLCGQARNRIREMIHLNNILNAQVRSDPPSISHRAHENSLGGWRSQNHSLKLVSLMSTSKCHIAAWGGMVHLHSDFTLK